MASTNTDNKTYCRLLENRIHPFFDPLHCKDSVCFSFDLGKGNSEEFIDSSVFDLISKTEITLFV